MADLVLYHFLGCPYCAKLHDYLKRRQISIPLKDTRVNPIYQEELIKIGGKNQVPCLVIDGQALYESKDIIQWFEDHWK